jgi:hypothetical protein
MVQVIVKANNTTQKQGVPVQFQYVAGAAQTKGITTQTTQAQVQVKTTAAKAIVTTQRVVIEKSVLAIKTG